MERLGKDILENLHRFDSGKTLIQTLIFQSKAFVIDPEAMHHGRVDLVDVLTLDEYHDTVPAGLQEQTTAKY